MLNLIIENGSGVAGANSYIDAVYMNQFAQMFGADETWCNNTSKQTLALIQASNFIDSRYYARLCGHKVSNEQGLLFPRKIKGHDTGIPESFKKAVAFLVIQYLTDGALDYNANSDAGIRSETVSVGGGAVSESRTYYDTMNARNQFSYFAQVDRYFDIAMIEVGCGGASGQFNIIQAWRG